jgi:hypothetical protein
MHKISLKNLQYSYNYFLTMLIIAIVILSIVIYVGYINPVAMIEQWIIIFSMITTGYLLFFSIVAVLGIHKQIQKYPSDNDVKEDKEANQKNINEIKNNILNAENKALLFMSFAVVIVIFNFQSLLLAAYIAAVAAILGILYSFSFHFYWLFIKTNIPGINNSESNK